MVVAVVLVESDAVAHWESQALEGQCIINAGRVAGCQGGDFVLPTTVAMPFVSVSSGFELCQLFANRWSSLLI